MKKLILALALAAPAFAQLCTNVSPNSMNCPVDASTGVTVNDSVIWNSTGTGVTIGTTSSTANQVIGWADQTVAAGGGQVLVHTFGPAKVNFDGGTTNGDGFTRSITTTGQFTDTGVAYSASTCGQGTLGVINQTIDSTGLATATFKPCVGAGTVASGTTAASGAGSLNNLGSIASTSCATLTVTATGVAATDSITFTPNASIKAVVGFTPATTGGLNITAYPTANNVNFDACNWSTGSLTPGTGAQLNWRVIR
jgi:hypothetical protein